VLVQDGKVTGLLDFEFSAIDYRAMELAVCLSKYAGEPEAMQVGGWVGEWVVCT
jgi:Ser/Thr protein kinase RdoA (MazF antagonist)